MPREFRDRQKYLLDFAKYESLLVEALTRLYKQATIEYVKAGARKIPSLTGQARASFIAAASSLGLDSGVSPGDQPLSSNMQQRQALMRAGNSAARGFGLGVAKITVDKRSARWNFKNTLTSAHNDYPYMDNDQWSAYAEGKAALKAYMSTHISIEIQKILKELHNGSTR